MSQAPYSHILIEAAAVADERNDSYGDSTKNFTDIQNILKFAFGIEISLEGIAQVFIATKLARDLKTKKDDNYIDAINYMAILQDFRQKNAHPKEGK
jgi:competence protein ComGF